MLITRAVTVRGVLFLRLPDTMTLSSSTVFDVAAEAREPYCLNGPRRLSRPTETFAVPRFPIIATDRLASCVNAG